MSAPTLGWVEPAAAAPPQSLFSVAAIRHVLTAFLATRLIIFAIVVLSLVAIPMRQGDFFFADADNILLDGLVRYDSWWYRDIIADGYSLGDVASGEQGNIAFFPLYPLLIQLVMKLSGSTSPFLPAILIANGSFLLGLFYLYALAAAEFDQETAARTVFYLAAAPAALFFSAFYTEGLYTLLIAATFYHSRAGDWLKAALFGALAAATRNTGILAALIIALEGLHQQGLRFYLPARGQRGDYLRQSAAALARSWPSLAAATFVGTGLLAFIVYLNSEFGDPLSIITVQQTWGREIGAGSFLNLVPNTVRELDLGGGLLSGRFNPIIIPDALFTLLALPLLLWLPRFLRPAHVAFCWATFLIPLSTGTVTSMSRYVLMLLPVFMVLGNAGRRPWLDRLILTLFLPLMAYVSILYSHWYFAG